MTKQLISKKLNKEKIRRILAKYYDDNYCINNDVHSRKLLVYPATGFLGAYFITIEGSGPKGYGIYFPCEPFHTYTITLYDCCGKRFKDFYLNYEISFD